METTKKCARCKEEKTLSLFYKISKTKGGISSRCKPCVDAQCEAWRRKRGAAPKLQRPEVPGGMRYCFRCDQAKRTEDFGKCARGVGGLTSWCRPCLSESSKKWRAKNLEKVKAYVLSRVDQEYQAAVKRLYGLTVDQYNAMLKSQNGCCAICKADKPGGRTKQWSVDHCHKTGATRGLLCVRCNVLLGHIEHSRLTASYSERNREVYLAATDYLKSPPAMAVLSL